jgi:hypothetical protein
MVCVRKCIYGEERALSDVNWGKIWPGGRKNKLKVKDLWKKRNGQGKLKCKK